MLINILESNIYITQFILIVNYSVNAASNRQIHAIYYKEKRPQVQKHTACMNSHPGSRYISRNAKVGNPQVFNLSVVKHLFNTFVECST